jgi:hypothetical protein
MLMSTPAESTTVTRMTAEKSLPESPELPGHHLGIYYPGTWHIQAQILTTADQRNKMRSKRAYPLARSFPMARAIERLLRSCGKGTREDLRLKTPIDPNQSWLWRDPTPVNLSAISARHWLRGVIQPQFPQRRRGAEGTRGRRKWKSWLVHLFSDACSHRWMGRLISGCRPATAVFEVWEAGLLGIGSARAQA